MTSGIDDPISPENAEQLAQSRRSLVRLVGRIIKSEWGSRFWRSFEVIMPMLFVAVAIHNWTLAKVTEELTAAWQEKYQAQTVMTYKATTENRCLGLAILSVVQPEKFPIPEWCGEVLARIAQQPATMESH